MKLPEFPVKKALMDATKGKDTILLAQDKFSHNAKKRFTYASVSDIKQLCDYLQKDNHLNEIIPYGAPVRLYFDLDDKELVDTPTITLNKFLDWICPELDLQPSDFIVLDASTTTKISFHLLCQTCYFESNEHQKVFVQALCTNKPNDVLAPDVSVYNHCGRNFRLVYQSKKGKNNPLRPLSPIADLSQTFIRIYDEAAIDGLRLLLPPIVEKKRPGRQPKSSAHPKEPSIGAFMTQGLTLRKTITDKEFKAMPPRMRYLSLIVLQPDRDNWLAVGMAIRGAGGTEAEWDRWSRLGKKYVRGETADFNTFRKEESYGMYHLRKWAKMCDPDYFRNEKQEVINEYVEYNLDGVNVIDEETRYVDQYGVNLKAASKYAVILAYLGAGKSTAIKTFINEEPNKRCLCITPRQTFAVFIAAEFDATCYLDTTNMAQHDRLVVQLESLHKVPFTHYDYVIIDESESVFKQFSSEKTMKGKHKETYNCLMQFMDAATKVIMADAFITRRTIDLCKSLGETTLIRSPFRCPSRTATEIYPDLLDDHLINSLLNEKKNIFACYSSQKALIDLAETKLKNARLGDAIATYHGKSDDAVVKGLKTINKTWATKRFVGVSPKVTVGCSFTEQHFHSCYIAGKPTCTVRDTFQSHMRPRHLIENSVFFSVPTTKQMCFYRSMTKCTQALLEDYEHCADIKRQLLIEEFKQTTDLELRIEIQNMLEETIPSGLKRILFFNAFEDMVSRSCYPEMFKHFLLMCGYKVKGIDKKTEIESSSCDSGAEETAEVLLGRYEAIPHIDYETANEIKDKISSRTALFEEKLMLSKYFYHNHLKADVDPQVEAIVFFRIYSVSTHEQLFMNAVHEKRASFKHVQMNDLHQSQYVELTQMAGFQLRFIQHILSVLGFRHSQDSETIVHREKMEALIEWVSNNRTEIHTVFAIRDRAMEKQTNTFRFTLDVINKVLAKWTGTALKAYEKDRKGSGITYRISVPVCFYDIIKDEKRQWSCQEGKNGQFILRNA